MTPTSGTGLGTLLEPSLAPLGHIPQDTPPWDVPSGCPRRLAGMSQTPYPSVGVIIISQYCLPQKYYMISLHTKFELSRTILAIPMYLHRKMLHLPVALNPKELVGDMSKL